MRIGIGLPTTVPGCDPELVTGWAARADAGPFSSLGVLDRLVYDSYDPLVSLGAAAAVTQRIRLLTMVAIAPLRTAGILAKQALSVHTLSGGRLTLGLALGARADDYQAAGAEFAGRGARFDDQLAIVRDLFEDPAVGPVPTRTPSGDAGGAGAPDLLVGGMTGAAYLRAARYADGYCHNGGPPRVFESAAGKARAAWQESGRPGEPQLWGQAYIGLEDADAGRDYLLDYYAFTGPFAQRIAAGLLDTPKAVKDHIRGYEDAGCDELVLFPTTADPDELDRLADAIA